MTALFFAVLFLIVGLVLLIIKKNIAADGGKAAFSAFSVIAFVIAVAFCIGACVKVVPTGHTGVVTTFGKV